MRVEQFLSDSAACTPDKIAVAAGKNRLSYRELDRLSDRLAGVLAGAGIEAGCRVAIFMADGIEAVIATFAVFKAGAILCPVDPAQGPEVLATLLNVERISGLFTQARFGANAAQAMSAAPSVKLVVLCGRGYSPPAPGCLNFEEVLRGWDKAKPLTRNRPDSDGALMAPGLTRDGVRRAVVSHRQLASAVEGLGPELQHLLPLPALSSERGLCDLLAMIRAGETALLRDEVHLPAPERAQHSLNSSAMPPTPAGLGSRARRNMGF
jgi:acyl-CoA synthetase (AMP-forming)/AMP-acid ligase II